MNNSMVRSQEQRNGSQNHQNGDNAFDFVINPELRRARNEVSPGEHLDIVFIVRNVSGRTVRAEALLRQFPGPGDSGAQPVLKIVEPAEWEYENTSVRAYTVQIAVPTNARPGTYNFQMLIVGTDDPDDDLVESSLVSIEVTIPPVNVRPFALAALAVLVAVILLVAGAAVLLLPHQGLQINVKTPPEITTGVPAQYQIQVTNRRGQPLNRVILNYAFPPAVIGASASVPDSQVRNCDEIERSLRCDLGRLDPGKSATVFLEIIPGPLARELTNTSTQTPGPTTPAAATTSTPGSLVQATGKTQSLTVSSLIGEQWSVTPVSIPDQPIQPAPAGQAFSVAIDPSSKTALVDEPTDIVLWAWSNAPAPATETITLTYKLPKGMRYVNPLPDNCEQPENDYFTLVCARGPLKQPETNTDVDPITIHVLPVEVSSSGFEHSLEANDQAGQKLPKLTATTAAVYPPLLFNGVDNYVNLGYTTALKTFTAEMWVQPFSTEDGQAFIGAHRQLPDNMLNMFLVGYYTGTLSVNVSGTYCDLDFQKTTDRFHLAVVVDNKGVDEWWVTAYKDGVVIPWRKQADQSDPTGGCQIVEPSQAPKGCDGCAIFKQDTVIENRLDGGETLPWVLGQDWDWGGQGPKLSDFFHGALSEVRLWKAARTQDELRATMLLRPLGNQTDPQGKEADLLGYWRLEPPAPADSNNLVIANLTNGPYDGKRIGAAWGDPAPRFGNALSYNGINDFLMAPGLGTSGLSAGADGKVKLTLSGWIYVDGVPTRQQWLMGYVPVGLSPASTTAGGPAGGPASVPPAALPFLNPSGAGNTPQPSAEEQQAAAQSQQGALNATGQLQAKQAAVVQARKNQTAAKTPAEQQQAQAQLQQAQADLDAAFRQYYINLQQAILQQENRETLLDNLRARLDLAVERSVEAGLAASTATVTPGANPALHGIRPAALLAAQQALKSDADGAVDAAWANYQNLVEARDLQKANVAAPPPNATAVAALNDKVDQARTDLENALAKQRAQSGDLKLESQMAEALAQALATDVTTALNAAIDSARPAPQVVPILPPLFPKITIPSQPVTLAPDIVEKIKTNEKVNLLQQIEDLRWRTRVGLWFSNYYTGLWLSNELANGGDRAEVRAAKTDLQGSLTSLNLSLTDALTTQGPQVVMVADPQAGIGNLLQQSADEARRAAIQQKLQDALKKADASLGRYLALPGAAGGTVQASAAPTPTPTPAAGLPGLGQVLAPTQAETPGAATATPGASATAGGAAAPVPEQLTPLAPGTTATPAPLPSLPAAPQAAPPTASQNTPPNIWAGLILTDDGHVALVARPAGDSGWTWFEDERPVAVGQWQHYAMEITFDANNGTIDTDPGSLVLVRNGGTVKGAPPGSLPVEVQVDQATCPAGFYSQAGFYIGGLCDTDGKFAFKGLIDDVRVWDRSLTSDEVDTWRNLPGATYDEVVYWPFDDLLRQRPVECLASETCNYGKANGYHLDVSGPAWVPADLSELQHLSVRP